MNIRRKLILVSIIMIIFLIIFNYNYNNKKIISHSNNIINDGHRLLNFNIRNNKNNSIIGYLNIPKINLKKELYEINSINNNVSYNVEINKHSDMPNTIGGNIILEAHSGNNYNSFFKDLYRLDKNDEIDIIFNGYIYKYLINDVYNIKKTGKATIKRDYHKSTITLITCTKNSDNMQTIYIGYLIKKECLD